MGLENKKDNKVDTRKNGRPVGFSTGDGEDFFIDLPESIPGLEDIDTENLSEEEAKNLIEKQKANTKENYDMLKSEVIDYISK